MEPSKQQIGRTVSMYDTLIFKRDVINKWKNKEEVWPFAYGDDILGTCCIGSSIYTMFFYRRRLKLLHYARLTSYGPVVGLSAILAKSFHEYYVTHKILNPKSCYTCTEVKAGLGQALAGCVYPLIMSPIICFYFANHILTYPVPPIYHAPKEVLQLYMKLTRPHMATFLTICGVQMLAAMFVTHMKFTTLAELKVLTEPKDVN